MITVAVLWEDQRSVSGTFNAGEVLLLCLRDQAVGAVVRNHALRGVGGIQNALPRPFKEDFVLAVPDLDRVHNHVLKPARDANTEEAFVEDFRARSRDREKVRVVFLRPNQEAVVAVACDVGGATDEERQRALAKDVVMRERLLGRLLGRTPADAERRARFVERCRSFQDLIETIRALAPSG